MGRIRLNVIMGRGRQPLHAFVSATTAPGTLIVTDGNTAYREMPDHEHHEMPIPKTVQAHIDTSGILAPEVSVDGRLPRPPEEARRRVPPRVRLRFNRRRHYRSSFERLLGIGVKVGAGTYWDITGKEPFFRNLKKAVRGQPYDEDAREDAYKRARIANVPKKYAKLLLDPDYPPERRRYRRKKPRRPVLAEERSAFVVAPFQAA